MSQKIHLNNIFHAVAQSMVLCSVVAVSSVAFAQQRPAPAPLRLILWDDPSTPKIPAHQHLRETLNTSAKIKMIQVDIFRREMGTQSSKLSPKVFDKKATIRANQAKIARVMARQNVETLLVWRAVGQGATLWVIGPSGRFRGEVKQEVFSSGSQGNAQSRALLARAFKLSAPVVLVWRAQKKRVGANNAPVTTPNTSVVKTDKTKVEPEPRSKPDLKKESLKKSVALNAEEKRTSARSPNKDKTSTSSDAVSVLPKSNMPAKQSSAILGAYVGPALTIADEEVSLDSRVIDNLPEQYLTGLSSGLSLTFLSNANIAYQVALGFDYVATNLEASDSSERSFMSMLDISTLFQVIMFFRQVHAVSFSAGPSFSRWAMTELYENAFTNSSTVNMSFGGQYTYWAIPSFLSTRVGFGFDLPITSEYGSGTDEFRQGYAYSIGAGLDVRVLSWLSISTDALIKVREMKYGVLVSPGSSFVSTVESQWSMTLLRLGAVMFW